MKIPMQPGELTTDWLTEALSTTGVLDQGCVTSCDVQLLVSDKGMTGPIARIHLTYDHDALDAPRSLIAKFSTPDPHARSIIHGMGFYEREVRFYAQLAAQSTIHTPHCYFSALNTAEGMALLLLEDLAPARNGNWAAGCSLAEAELAVGTLAALHAVWWQHPLLEHEPWVALRSLISVEQTPAVFAQAWEPFLATYGTPIADEVLEAGAWLTQYLAPLSAYIYQQAPCTLLHNDYQADNLFFVGVGSAQSLAVIDWQLATRGRAALDVASFLGGHLAPNERRDHEERLVHMYHTLLIDNGVRDYPLEQCWDDYRLAMLVPLCRIMSVVGLGAPTEAQTRRYCDIIVPRFCQATHDLQIGDILHAAFPQSG